jgi:hypothetical protein
MPGQPASSHAWRQQTDRPDMHRLPSCTYRIDGVGRVVAGQAPRAVVHDLIRSHGLCPIVSVVTVRRPKIVCNVLANAAAASSSA